MLGTKSVVDARGAALDAARYWYIPRVGRHARVLFEGTIYSASASSFVSAVELNT